MFNLFKKESKEIEVMAPLKGEIVKIEDVDDQVFAQKMVGDGVAISPTDDTVVAPFDGEIIQVFDTKHAIGLKAKNGVELLIHIGLETVNLKGEGFDVKVKAGDKVKIGEPLVIFNRDYISKNAKSLVTPIVITNADEMEAINKIDKKAVDIKEKIMDIVKK
ncbi:PTS glucose transporter subunit IIA [Proteinivorax hydrogeniformans]|uniref:PTS glucose transporter subunit IIA n=1 Tax=Proteinivorax hydrogeniformans TaxID=1826727 RepID=A0AAU8HRU6_9FIRM